MPLPVPATAPGGAGLAAILANPATALIALDYDGTLAPIVARPEDARPANGAVDALVALAKRVGTVAIVTGRPVRDVVGFLRLDRLDGLAGVMVAGHYGLERWAGGAREAPDPAPGVSAARRQLPQVLADAPDGVSVEDKEHSLVVHTRRTTDPTAVLAALQPALRRLADEVGLEAVPGRFVLELRPAGIDKGAALRRLVSERGAGSVLFAGDDLGDLPAYDAVEALRADGIPGCTVCSDSAEAPVLRERADLVVPGPTGVVALLRALAGAFDAG